MIKLCHPYCTACTDDKNSDCSSCNYGTYQAKLSGTTCDLTCAATYGNDTVNVEVCIKCGANCQTCLDSASNCLTCDNNYYLYDNTTDVTCVFNCPSSFFKNNTASPRVCEACDASCLECNTLPTTCTQCHPN
jgi:proprotein convertase subtilisin/kexin type 5